ncbi:MAG TPA: T9SS type A sorting domain-containing protein [Saprospiraceae bacterium]|nr:T9SS type A sorting domain-containing protein [Saprospiraceae bacterium]
MNKHSHTGSVLILFLWLCIYSSTAMMAQTIDRQVLSAAGENYETVNGSLVFTVGEIAVETFEKEVQLTQGFHQEWAVITSVASASADPLHVSVYPNPTIGILNIESESEVQIFLYDLSGKLKIKASQPLGSGQIDVSDFPAGIYVLEVIDQSGKKKVLKIEKVE